MALPLSTKVNIKPSMNQSRSGMSYTGQGSPWRNNAPLYQSNTQPAVASMNLGDELRQNTTTVGAFGNWGQKPNSFNQPPQAGGSPYNNTFQNNNFNSNPNLSNNPANSGYSFNQPANTVVQPQANFNNQNPKSTPNNQNSGMKLSASVKQKYNSAAPISHKNQIQFNPNIFNPNQSNQGQFSQNIPHQGQNNRQAFFPNNQFPPSNNMMPRPVIMRQPLPPRPKVSIQPSKKEVDILRKMSPADLRKEVIKQEVEIQKKLIESEKEYRKGVSTIRDLVSPSSVKITGGYMELGTKFVRSFFVLTYPRVINTGWLDGLVNTDLEMDLSIFIYPRDSSQVLKELRGKVGKIEASLHLNQEKGMPRDPALETAFRDVESLRDAIQQGIEKFFKLGVYMQIYANSLEDLEKKSVAVEGVLNQQNIITKRASLQIDDGFNSCLPILRDDLQVHTNMNTSPLSASFPFVSSELSSDTGILYGINRHNSSLVIFDRFEMENANEVVFATSGAGKSYAVKLEVLRSLMTGVSVIIIDPEQEYKVLADTLGGTYVNMSLNSNNRINPFDLPKPLDGESTADLLRTSIIDLMGLMNLMLGELKPDEVSIMERAIKESYAKRDINETTDLKDVTVPTMQDLVNILEGTVGGESMAQRLYRYTEGTFSGLFNKRTNINIDNNLVVFNIRDLQEPLRPIAMYILLKYVWNEIRSELKRRILAIDEAWIMMQYEDSARFLFGLVKRARKYYLGVTTITQDVGDFLSSPFGKPIVTNSALKLLLKQSSASIDLIGDIFALTTGEKQVLLQSTVGQGIFFAGPRHVAIEVIAFPTEHRIITTNPKDLLKMQQFAKEQQ